jgi:hypothetical protein
MSDFRSKPPPQDGYPPSRKLLLAHHFEYPYPSRAILVLAKEPVHVDVSFRNPCPHWPFPVP